MIGTKEAAKMIGCTRDYVASLCRRGVFRSAEQDAAGSPWRLDEEEVRRYAKNKRKKLKGGNRK